MVTWYCFRTLRKNYLFLINLDPRVSHLPAPSTGREESDILGARLVSHAPMENSQSRKYSPDDGINEDVPISRRAHHT